MLEPTNKPVTMTSFAELTKQVHLINDLILADMTCGMLIFLSPCVLVSLYQFYPIYLVMLILCVL